jgi:predicted oxidoreductase
MDDLDSRNPFSAASMGALIRDARADFEHFYRTSSTADSSMMDDLILTHACFAKLMNAPRHHIPPAIRAHLEKSCDSVEQVFTHLRELVRACPTFAGLSAAERAQIEREVFAVRPMESE